MEPVSVRSASTTATLPVGNDVEAPAENVSVGDATEGSLDGSEPEVDIPGRIIFPRPEWHDILSLRANLSDPGLPMSGSPHTTSSRSAESEDLINGRSGLLPFPCKRVLTDMADLWMMR